jgi:hypothetical protein
MEKPITLTLWHDFTELELLAKGQELSARVHEFASTETDKKASADAFKTKLEVLDYEIQQLSREIRSKGAQVPTPCVVRFHEPKTGWKQTVRLDSGEIVREEAMTAEESQENLFPERAMEAGA